VVSEKTLPTVMNKLALGVTAVTVCAPAPPLSFSAMPTPEQQREYMRLSALLQQVCMRHKSQLPGGTASVLVTAHDGEIRLDAYDRFGKIIGTIPNEETSDGFLSDLTRLFFGSVTSDPDGIVASIW
jgi:hypothetical protein